MATRVLPPFLQRHIREEDEDKDERGAGTPFTRADAELVLEEHLAGLRPNREEAILRLARRVEKYSEHDMENESWQDFLETVDASVNVLTERVRSVVSSISRQDFTLDELARGLLECDQDYRSMADQLSDFRI